jgi:hypothetical protein
MSRRISIDGAAAIGTSLLVSDADYVNVDWGNSADDVVVIPLENGGEALLNWLSIGAIFIPGASPPPGTYPSWNLEVRGPYGGVSGLNVNEATKDAMVAQMSNADTILEFTTLQGTDVKLPTKNATAIIFDPGDFVVAP